MYNKEFILSLEDLEIIEEALRKELHKSGSSKIAKLLGRLHDQKIWYRPDNYIGG